MLSSRKMTGARPFCISSGTGVVRCWTAVETKLKLELLRSAARTQIGPLIQDMEQGIRREEGPGD
jgi:hypothetical protein